MTGPSIIELSFWILRFSRPLVFLHQVRLLNRWDSATCPDL
jgi:hypothetical protein